MIISQESYPHPHNHGQKASHVVSSILGSRDSAKPWNFFRKVKQNHFKSLKVRTNHQNNGQSKSSFVVIGTLIHGVEILRVGNVKDFIGLGYASREVGFGETGVGV